MLGLFAFLKVLHWSLFSLSERNERISAFPNRNCHPNVGSSEKRDIYRDIFIDERTSSAVLSSKENLRNLPFLLGRLLFIILRGLKGSVSLSDTIQLAGYSLQLFLLLLSEPYSMITGIIST